MPHAVVAWRRTVPLLIGTESQEGVMRRIAVLFVSLMFVAACGSDPAPSPTPTPVCTAGSSTACTCSDGRSGAQVCSASGTGYGSCVCGGLPDAGTPIDMGCPSENGASACNRIIGSWCSRVMMCCNAAGAGVCVDWGYDDALCRAEYVAAGTDCSSSTYTSTTSCIADVDRCVGDVPLVACSDIIAGTGNWPASCDSAF